MAELIASGTTAANSADFTVPVGQASTVFLKDGNSAGGSVAGANAAVQIKSADGYYYDVAELTTKSPVALLDKPGTYRVQRKAAGSFGAAYGVDYVLAGDSKAIVELASAARTTTQTGADRASQGCKGLHVVVDVTSAGTGSITPKVQGKGANGIYYDLLVSAAITANGTTVLKVYPGITVAANVSAADILPGTFRVVVTANNANSMTYSVGVELVA